MPLSILAVSGNDAFCGFLDGLLSADGHRMTCVREGREALKAAQCQRPDLVVLEVSMPAAVALDTMQRLQRTADTRHIPVIVISDSPELEYELLNVFDFIHKPVDINRLREDLAILARGGTQATAPLKIGPMTESDYRLFYEYLVAFSGLHFERRNMKILERGLINRMAALRTGSYLEYFDFLIQHRESRRELQKLLQFLTIGETYFFRYHAHFEALQRIIVQRAASGNGLRLWSAGCSTGEEPYSMAISIMEALPDWEKRDVRVLATDINNRALHRAREGVYGNWSMRVMEKRYLDRYFERVGGSYVIRDEVKSLVEFSHLNLQTADFPLSTDGETGFDAIFCRNVMIYFTLATTRKIVDKFASSLKPEGCLFLGHAETLSQISTRFERHALVGCFYYSRKQDHPKTEREPKPPRAVAAPSRPAPVPMRPPAPLPPPPPLPRPLPAAVPPPPPVQDPAVLFRQAQALFDAEDYTAAAMMLVEVIQLQPDHVEALLTQGFILANNGLIEDSLEVCDEVLASNDLLPEAYLLKGLIFDITDRLAEAAAEYGKAILLKMDMVMPHYHLGKVYVRMGRMKDGVRELRNCLKILEREGEESLIPYSSGLSREVMMEQVRRELARLTEQT